MQLLHEIGPSGIHESADNRLYESTIKRQVGPRHAVNRGEAAIVRHVVDAQCANVVERSQLASHDPVAGSEIRIDTFTGPTLELGLVETRRERVDQIDIA